ncbi:MAG: hypothetical protein R2838_10580 [Caldilineaceae bacterium]
MLALYQRQFQPLIGGSADAGGSALPVVAYQKAEHLLAVDAAGTPTGYLILYKSQEGPVGVEASADDWPTAAALLLRPQCGTCPRSEAVVETPVRVGLECAA